jgi:diaminopimelate decarboxylase
MKRQYEKPSIIKLSGPIASKSGHLSKGYPHVRNVINNQDIEHMTKRFGSPLFVFDEESIRERYRKTVETFKQYYPKVNFAWSYKTNYLRSICEIFHSEGAWAEVVSEFEYQKAKKIISNPQKIIYNGPYKTEESLEQALLDQASIHIDHFEEIRTVEQLARKLNLVGKIGIRINFDCGIYPSWSRFGLNLESGQAWSAVKYIAESDWLNLNGLHTHIGTFVLEPSAYEQVVSTLVKLKYDIEDEYKMKIEYLDFGGGFPSKGHLKGVYQAPDVSVPNIDEYAKVIGSALKHGLRTGDLPEIFLESGRYLIDESGFLITSIVAQKILPDGRRSYVLDAGVNLLYTSTWYKYKVELAGEETGPLEPAILNGPLCMNIDIVDEAILLPRLKNGKKLVLSPVGAYNVTQWMQFIHYRPAVVLIRNDQSIELIRDKEDLNYVERLERDATDKGIGLKNIS